MGPQRGLEVGRTDRNKQGPFYGAFPCSRSYVFRPHGSPGPEAGGQAGGALHTGRATQLEKAAEEPQRPSSPLALWLQTCSQTLRSSRHSAAPAWGKPGQAGCLCDRQILSCRTGQPTACLRQRLSPKLCSPLSFQYIPMPVLYGVFLYMGVASLNGIQVRPSPKGQRSESGSISPRPQMLAFPVQ